MNFHFGHRTLLSLIWRNKSTYLTWICFNCFWTFERLFSHLFFLFQVYLLYISVRKTHKERVLSKIQTAWSNFFLVFKHESGDNFTWSFVLISAEIVLRQTGRFHFSQIIFANLTSFWSSIQGPQTVWIQRTVYNMRPSSNIFSWLPFKVGF